MIHVRGIAFIGAMQFIKEEFGAEGHERVLAELPEVHRPTFSATLREAGWKPLDALAAYAGTAKRLLAPHDDQFYTRLGFRAGRVEREEGGFQPMVADRATAIRLGAVIWRTLYDSGRMELVPDGERNALARIYDFETSPAICQANAAALSGLLGSDERPVRTEQTACVLDGAACCEFRIAWEP